jgi:SAM-dependent methyltransferase
MMSTFSTARNDRDIYRLAPSADAAVLEMMAARLEFRGTDDGYVRLSQGYLARLPRSGVRRIVALGCGTGIEVRALRRLMDPGTVIVGVDHSPELLDVARQLTVQGGLAGNVTYSVADAHDLPYVDGEFDIVIMHTLISHVDEPIRVLREARRVVRPGGTVAVFDGDYASLTFGYPDHAVATAVEEKLIQLIVANPRIMRDLPRMLSETGLALTAAEGALYANVGSGSFWAGAAESYGALLARSGLLAEDVVERWRAFQARSAADNTLFAASSYYTYLARRSD